jgi:hypothetical protein
MRKTVVIMALLLPLFASAAHAINLDDATLAKRCPGTGAWMKTHQQGADISEQADAHATFTQPALRTELRQMAQADQQARGALFKNGSIDATAEQVVIKVDAENLKRLKEIVSTQGFPTVTQVGGRGVNAAFLLIQHADTDPAFQQQVLDILQARTDSEALNGEQLAMLTDRVLTHQDKPQRYGTQFMEIDNEWKPKPMEDPTHVDQRRATMGLMPLNDYACMLKAMYGS